MPKQIYKIEHFHGGLNSNSDPRDISTTELSSATDVMVDEVGSIRTMGNIQSTFVALGSNLAMRDDNATLVAGAGFFQFDHDRTGAEDAGDSEAETGDNYLALYDDSDAQVWVYSKALGVWNDDKDESADEAVINFKGSSTSLAAKPVFTSIDGALRVSIGDFTNHSASAVNMGSDLTSTGTALTVDSATSYLVGSYVRVDDEIMYVTAKPGSEVLTVKRGMFGTRSVAHSDDANVYILNMNQWYGYLNNKFFQSRFYSFTDSTCDTTHTGGSTTTVNHDANSNIVAGLSVSGNGIPAGVTISSITSPTAFVISSAATVTATDAVLTFSDLTNSNKYTTDKWHNDIQHLRSLDELGIILTLDDSQGASPGTGSLTGGTFAEGGGKIIVSYWAAADGFWNGSYWLGLTPVYIGDQEGPISTVKDSNNNDVYMTLSDEVLNVQLYICHGDLDHSTIDYHPLGDDRIIGVNLYTKAYTSDEWFLLKKFDLLEGGEHGWKEYNGATGFVATSAGGNLTSGFWNTSGTLSMADPSSLDSYEHTTAVVTVTPADTAMAGRTGTVRVSGFYKSPLYGTVNLGQASAQTVDLNVINPGPSLQATFIVELLDENFNILESYQDEVAIADSGASSPSVIEDPGYTGSDLYAEECFLQGTQILMSSGSMRDIVDISVGDSIASYSKYHKSYTSGIVTDVLAHPIGRYVCVAIINDKLYGTPNHPIFIDGKWIEIYRSNLDVKYKLMYVDTYYNLEVDGDNIFGSDHNYIANGYIASGLGDNDILNKAIPRQDIFMSINNG